jgi:fused signal recognition particle receptor
MPFGFFKKIAERFLGKPVDWDDLEELLIRADLGVPTTNAILDTLRKREGALTAETVIAVAREEILRVLPRDNPPLRPLPNRPRVILVVGVNGTGKTTTTAKLAHALLARRHTVLLAAADTFRAAAIEQLALWAERLGVEMIRGQYGADPAALCHDAWQSASRRNTEFLICDTAGRLHTKDNLMQELGKVKRALAKLDPTAPHECLLVIDATTGSNALVQAREFHKAAALTGLVLTKLDGSGKGGVAVSIQRELGVPVRYIGTGEKPGDLAPFETESFVERML